MTIIERHRRALFAVPVGLCLFAPIGCAEPPDGAARVVIADDGHHEYETYDAEDRVWRRVMLPGTMFGMTVVDWTKPDGKPSGVVGKPGHPTGIADFASDAELRDYIRSQKVKQFQPMEDGAAVIERADGTWTVWTQELLGAYLAAQMERSGEGTPDPTEATP